VDFGFKVKDLINMTGERPRSSTSDVDRRLGPPLEAGGKQGQVPVQSAPAATSDSKPLVLEASPPDSAPPALSAQQQDTPDAPERAQPLDFSLPVKLKEEVVSTGEALSRASGPLLTSPSADRWKEHPLVIRYGSTISRIAADVYGTNLFLAIDLLKEFNIHIGNLNWVLAGEKLWLPPISQETLLRKQEDGSYRFILGSFRSLVEAERLAQAARRKGYVVSITPRRVSDDFLLYRVEITQLKNLETANKTWDTARTHRWLTLLEDSEEKPKQLNY
jgi:hypothetical protein